MFTTDQIAQMLGVDKTTAYGLLRFLATKGLIEVSKASSNGKRGKPAMLYKVDKNNPVHALLFPNLGKTIIMPPITEDQEAIESIDFTP